MRNNIFHLTRFSPIYFTLKTTACLLLFAAYCCSVTAQEKEETAPQVQTEKIVSQYPVKAPSQLRDDFLQEEKSRQKWEDFSAGPVPLWIWGPSQDGKYRLKTTFAGNVKTAQLRATCDNVMILYLNGKKLASSSEWQAPVTLDISSKINSGQNELIAEVSNQSGAAAFVLKLIMTTSGNKKQYLITDSSWQIVDQQGKQTEDNIKVIAKMGEGPWKDVFSKEAAETGVPRDTFVLLPGYEVETLFTVPKETHGSWVAIAFDNKGRLLASDQGDKGIFRITPAAIGCDQATRVERLDFDLTSAQGMLYAFDSLYLSINGGPGSGLYRARDTNGDDQYDEVIKLKDFQGGGEHGPHALRLSPDGKSIYVICGNHTNPPFKAGEEKENPLYSSRIPTNWGEDLLLPRQWDANGHARGKLAPGGWIAKTDPEGKTWEVFSIGYRNPYDMDFNRNGDLFAYDADMEWDIGTPWYRPTRVVHASSGSEFGWRSGTGKWLPNYPDSLPQLVDIGPGSPVGACFGYGTNFPARYERAFYICDWTFGTMYAIHMQPSGSTYQAIKEEFLSRTPLPLTDVAVGPDGALYFTSGGRGTQSELFRVIYTGKKVQSHQKKEFASEAKLRQERKRIEKLHHDGLNLDSKQIQHLVKQLGNSDRFIRYASRIALEHQPSERWTELVLNQKNNIALINGIIGLARQANPRLQPRLISALEGIDFSRLDNAVRLDLIRAMQLVFIRMGKPDEKTADRLASKYDPFFPAQEETNSSEKQGEWAYSSLSDADALNRVLSELLVYLNSKQISHKLVTLLKQDRQNGGAKLNDLLARNRSYGSAIAAMIANQPDLQQVHYAFVLRNLKNHWTMEDRIDYFKWFQKAAKWNGGNSYRKFLQNIDDEAYLNMPEPLRIAVEAAGARKPFAMPELPQAKGPGKDWTVEEVLKLAEEKLKRGRDFENGQKMYAATRCIVCHRFNGDGGATGPDLTQLAGRFNLKDLTEAIIEPDKIISDQYRAMQVITEEGKSYVGRIISETDDQITLLIDPEDSTKIVDIPKESIDESIPSQTSLMPKDLLKPLNENEVLDLLAYLLSRGNPKDPMFRKK